MKKPGSSKQPVGRAKPLGRGLAALLGDMSEPDTATVGIAAIAVDKLRPSELQPRSNFSEESLDELGASIKAHGVIQPIIVRPVDDSSDTYEIIAGERRWRASMRVGLAEVPVLVRSVADEDVLGLALVENLQREDLSPIEEAEAYRRLLEDFGLTQDTIAVMVGRSRPQITNTLRLLRLPPPVRAMVDDGRLTAGHARALINTVSPEALAERVVRDGLTVRDTEKLAQAGIADGPPNDGQTMPRDPNIIAVEQELMESLGLKASVKARENGRGSLTLHYRSLEQLDGLLALLHGRKV